MYEAWEAFAPEIREIVASAVYEPGVEKRRRAKVWHGAGDPGGYDWACPFGIALYAIGWLPWPQSPSSLAVMGFLCSAGWDTRRALAASQHFVGDWDDGAIVDLRAALGLPGIASHIAASAY